jgi:hypothetical protein
MYLMQNREGSIRLFSIFRETNSRRLGTVQLYRWVFIGDSAHTDRWNIGA